MVVSDLVSALVVACIPLVSRPGRSTPWPRVLGCGRQFAGPARMALLPDVVGRDLVGGANSLLMLTRNLVLLVGPALGGALVAWRGTDPAFWLDAATFLGSAAVLALWRHHEPLAAPLALAASAGGNADVVAATTGEDDPTRTLRDRLGRLWRDVNAGLAGVREHPGLRVAFGFFAVLTFVTAMQQPLVVVFVKDVLGGGDRQLGFIIAAAGLGGIVGAVAGGVAVSRRRPLQVIALLTALDGLLLLAFALNRSVWVALALFACFGALATLAQIALATFLQSGGPGRPPRPHLRLAGHRGGAAVPGRGLPGSHAGEHRGRGGRAGPLRGGRGAGGRPGRRPASRRRRRPEAHFAHPTGTDRT